MLLSRGKVFFGLAAWSLSSPFSESSSSLSSAYALEDYGLQISNAMVGKGNNVSIVEVVMEVEEEPVQAAGEVTATMTDAAPESPCKVEIHEFDAAARKGRTKFRVGVDAIRGLEAASEEYSLLFGDYLTNTAGRKFDPPLEFEMVPMSFSDFFEAASVNELDFVFANPGMFSCFGVELAASALATVIARLDIRGRVHDLDMFAGK